MAPLNVTLWMDLPDSSQSVYGAVSFIAFILQRDKLDPKSSYLPKARKVGRAIAEIQTLTAEFSPLPAGVLALSLWRRSSRHFGGV